MNKTENFTKRVQIALQRPLYQRCEEINKLIEESSTKELHNFFPELLSNVFGYDNRSDWGLRSITPSHREFELLRVFLGPQGPMFRLIEKLQVDGHLKYEFFIRLLPLPSQKSLLEGVIPVLYHNKISSPAAAHRRNNSGVILLNAFEYYMFHFAYFIIYQQNHKVQDYNWLNGTECPYMVILEDYLNHFLPSNGSLVTASPLSSQSTTNLSRNPAWQGGGGGVYGRAPPNPSTQLTGLIRTPSSGHMTTTSAGHASYGHSTGEVSRSESFVQILIEFWLNQNTMDGVTSNVLSHGQQYFLPGVDLVRVVRMLIKQVHCFVYSAGIDAHSQPVVNPDDDFKRNIIPQMLQKKLYCFLRHCFAHWPLDPSFRVVIETWLSYIQPWRYSKQIGPIRAEQGGDSSFTPEWSGFVHENLLFYTALLHQFVLRALKLDLFSVKDAFILLRGSKVLSQNNLIDVIESDEKLLQVPSGGGKGSLRGSASSIGVSLPSMLRAHIAELEGSSYVYTPVLQQPGLAKLEELRYLAQSVLAGVSRQQPGGYHGNQHSTSSGGVTGFIKSFMSGDFLNDDSAVKTERDKLVSHLQQATDNLACIISVSGDVTDTGDMTVPWATASPVRGRLLTSAPATPGFTMPECEQTDRGLVLTDRGKYQVITGIRRPEVFYMGDPELQPIRSFENATLVRSLYKLSMYLNGKLGDTLQHIYNSPGTLGNLACTISPAITTSPTHTALGASPRTQSHGVRRPRLSLRYLASYRTMFYLLLLYLLCRLFGLGSVMMLVVFIIVLFGSVITNVGPAYEIPTDLHTRLFSEH